MIGVIKASAALFVAFHLNERFVQTIFFVLYLLNSVNPRLWNLSAVIVKAYSHRIP
jgi:hypothetical protein